MSIETIGARLAEIGQMTQTLTQRPASDSTTSFASALQNAQLPNMAQTMASTQAAPVAGGDSTQFDSQINQAAQKYGLDPAVLKGLIKQESGFNPAARSHAGAQGLTQLMPGTAAGLGVSDPTDPAQAIDGGARYLKEQLDRFGGDISKALAAYNAGPGAVSKYGGVPPYEETQNYVRNVLANAERYRSASAANTVLPPAAATGQLPAVAPSAAPLPTAPILNTTTNTPGSLPYSTT